MLGRDNGLTRRAAWRDADKRNRREDGPHGGQQGGVRRRPTGLRPEQPTGYRVYGLPG